MVEPVSTGAAAGATAASALFGITALVFAFWGFIILLVLFSVVLVLWALYSILTSKNKDEWKLLWSLVVVFAGWIGVVLYYFIGKKERIRK